MENKRLCCEHFLPNDILCYGVGKVVVKNGCYPNDINGPVSDGSNSRMDCMPGDANPLNNFINSSNVSLNSVSDDNDINDPVSDGSNCKIDSMPVDANPSNDFINSSNYLSFNSVSDNACNEEHNLNVWVDESVFDLEENESIHDFNRQSSSQQNIESPPHFSINPKMVQKI